jgi:hypothetical protein
MPDSHGNKILAKKTDKQTNKQAHKKKVLLGWTQEKGKNGCFTPTHTHTEKSIWAAGHIIQY